MAVFIDAMNRIEAGSGGTGHVQVSIRTKRQVIRSNGRFECGEHVNLPLPADLENGSAAVADEKIVVAVETIPVATPMPSTKVETLPEGET
jgi:hypothetical protein